MLSFVIKPMIRRHIDQLNAGNYEPLLKMAATDAELRFPGDNSWSRTFRAPGSGTAYTTRVIPASISASAHGPVRPV